jgi:aryl-phospho-beta-D-glucosidase BglC (GH1 family)
MKPLHYLLLFVFLAFIGCGEDEDNVTTLSVNSEEVTFGPNGGNIDITIRTNAKSWNIVNDGADWLEVSSLSGTNSPAKVTLSVDSKSLERRTTTLTISAGSAQPIEITVAQVASDNIYTITTDKNNVTLSKSGTTTSLMITTDAPQWSITSDVDWIEFSESTGDEGETSINITASENTGDAARTATITIAAAGAESFEIPVLQKGLLYPSYNTSPLAPDATGMSSTAVELAAKIHLGWNIGNSLEATGSETAWGNPLVSKALIDLVKQNGFNAIRIPCSWNQYMQNATTAQLKTDWLNRVKQVVQYCVDNDMYVLVNIHWDGGWLENNITPEKQEENNAKQQAFWEQIATHLREFDEHLLFASANEPNVETATQMAVLNSYHQTFVDAVRSTGGKNSYRVLVVQGPSTDIERTNNLMSTLPTDEIANRMMVEVHYYTPWNFCGLERDESWGKMFYYWGQGYHSATDTERNANWGEEATVDTNFGLMKSKFVDNGIPVVLGEYGATRRVTLTGDALTLHLASRAYYLKYVTQKAKAYGLLPFYWDNGGGTDSGMAIFNRSNNTVSDQQALDALVEGANQ